MGCPHCLDSDRHTADIASVLPHRKEKHMASHYQDNAYENRSVQKSRHKMPSRLLTMTIMFMLPFIAAIPARAAENTLYAFHWWLSPDSVKGSYPLGTLLRDSSGALYGSTWFGGAYGYGTIYKRCPRAAGQNEWNISLLYSFSGAADGRTPNPVLAMDSTGALYGTTQYGGWYAQQGVVFKLTPPTPGTTQWQYTVLYTFNYSSVFNYPDGAFPAGGLIMGGDGALYGTTNLGGVTTDPYGRGFGTVFRLTPIDEEKTSWQETVLYRFESLLDGKNPSAALAQDATGALYGTTLYGGAGPCIDILSAPIGCGTVFKLSPPTHGQTAWTKTTLHNFMGGTDGNTPEGKLLLDSSGRVYGTTTQGGFGACKNAVGFVIGCGTVYRLTPAFSGLGNWSKSILHSFSGDDGSHPQGGVIMDNTGALFGTASEGGPVNYANNGVVYKLAPTQIETNWMRSVLYSFDLSTGTLPIGELVSDLAGNLFGVTNSGGPNGAGVVYQITP